VVVDSPAPPSDVAPGAAPTFSPDLTLDHAALLVAGGDVVPAFVALDADACTGTVTAGAGCPAVPAPWGTGGQVCTRTVVGGTTTCSPDSTPVAIPANSLANNCTYVFQATCTHGALSAMSQTAAVSVTGTKCVEGDPTGDVATLTRQCSGNVRAKGSGSNPSGATWDNTLDTWFTDTWPWPSMAGLAAAITVNANQYASFRFVTGPGPAGATITTNNTFGATAQESISTVPGMFFTNVICTSSDISMSTKATTIAPCKLEPNTAYYFNVSWASTVAPHDSVCGSTSCPTGYSVYQYSN
jgi:hypothetical protein